MSHQKTLLLHGRFYIPTVSTAVRTLHVVRRPAISFTYYQGNDLAIIVHGSAAVIRAEDASFPALEVFQRECTGGSVREWGDGVFLQIIPKTLYTFARHPNSYAAVL